MSTYGGPFDYYNNFQDAIIGYIVSTNIVDKEFPEYSSGHRRRSMKWIFKQFLI